MAQSVKLSDDVMAHIRRESALQSRSVAGQITHWINIGRAIEQSSTFDYLCVRKALAGKVSPDELTAEEQEVWFAEFTAGIASPGEDEARFFAERHTLGRGVGMAEDGSLVYQSPPDP